MRYRSTGGNAESVSLREAVLSGLAPDGGLYMPALIAPYPPPQLKEFRTLPVEETSVRVLEPFVTPDVSRETLREITAEAFNFPASLVQLWSDLHVLELFHGPTLAFKDFGARFMARLMGHFVRGERRELTVLVATSGDTGSAVAQGFLGVPGIRVVILYPSGRVSQAQEKQFATLGQNITALEIAGSFDDCQRLVKQAFSDPSLRQSLALTSANSINIARLLPQMLYYVQAFCQLGDRPLVVSVPSGNFGNLTAGLLAKRAGIPIARLVAATNANDVVPKFLASGVFEPRPAKQTCSNAMDVGNPSNLARLLDLCQGSVVRLRSEIFACSMDDQQTLGAMRSARERYHYLLDPHTAVGVLGWQAYKREHPEPVEGLVLGTAHPAKFADIVQKAIGEAPPLPERLAQYLVRSKLSVPMNSSYDDFKSFLLER
jgi:threonine synthase